MLRKRLLHGENSTTVPRFSPVTRAPRGKQTNFRITCCTLLLHTTYDEDSTTNPGAYACLQQPPARCTQARASAWSVGTGWTSRSSLHVSVTQINNCDLAKPQSSHRADVAPSPSCRTPALYIYGQHPSISRQYAAIVELPYTRTLHEWTASLNQPPMRGCITST